ncbi:MAG: Lead, cadmium, zinc and mercury transporting ATPase (EC (EC; Copper-translocating P-type ATPase (EC [uncultured Thiotrichaceae bacterium]|uniref:P-type Zn(2+) transporter n=1 Tax=uncultured Thiotrichaceae bacterium TaxID=298394 RepID=A0A6S6UHZ9_9GAMM|nr:MAG: Lead, cadmium, zinc and mercury transporting ATPase (EC (EC; Copper-translocating P-type ATPase (EC [uncultured Thiotrichaceae bacterium]
MPIGLTAMLGTYAMLRVIDHRKKLRQKQLPHKVSKTPISTKKNLKSKQATKTLLTRLRNIDPVNRRTEDDLKLALISVGIAASQPIIFPGWSVINAFLISYSAYPYIRGFEKSIAKKHISNDVLGASWVILAVSGQQYFAAALGNVIYHIGSSFIAKTRENSRKSMVHIFNRENRNAWVIREGVEIEVPLVNVVAEDIVVVRSGEMIPVDGKVVDGSARIDEHVLTGESQVVEKAVDDPVFASTLLVSGYIQILVEKAGSETVVAKIETTLKQTADFKSQLQMKGEEWADKSAPYLLGAAGLTAITLGPIPAVAVLAAQFGYQIRMIAPLSTLRHLSKATHASILIKDGRSLETLNSVDTILFDKTGTLTEEQPQVGQVITWGNYTAEQVLRLAAIAEFKLKHPVALAILQAYEQYNQELPEIDATHYEMGFGTRVDWNGQTIRVGSLRFMQNQMLFWDEQYSADLEAIYERGHSVALVGVDNAVIAAIEIKPTIRPEIPELIANLKKRGKHLAIISGDQERPTQNLAKHLGIKQYFAEVLPQDKASIVEQFKQQDRKVCFVGDGINDTIAMKTADVSISLQGASSIATDTADILLMSGDLQPLKDLLDIADNLQNTLQRSAWLVATPSALVLTSSIFLHTGLLLAMLIKNTFLGANLLYVLKKSKPASIPAKPPQEIAQRVIK